jgi:tetratricopeptide (TPR) repeat protein
VGVPASGEGSGRGDVAPGATPAPIASQPEPFDAADPTSPAPPVPVVDESRDYIITLDDAIGSGGPKQKYRDNVAAIRALKTIEAEARPATPEEQRQLARYVGWGGLRDTFDTKHETDRYRRGSDWAREYDELKALLTTEEYESARKSVTNAHFSSELVIRRGLWDAIEHLGFLGGRMLESSAVIGNIPGLQPTRTITQRTLVELDSLTGRMLRLLYPRADVRVQGFESVHIPDNFYSLNIGNVPFGEFGVVDTTPMGDRYSERGVDRLIHDYFLAKGIDTVRPGGVMAVITSAGTMDKASTNARVYLAERAELLGAIRLPNTAFKGNAGTEVTADILFFLKRQTPISRTEAEQAFRTALQEAEQFGPTDTRVALVLNNLASLCHNQRNLAEAEALYQRALAIRRQAYGPQHPLVAQSLNNLASLYRELGKYQEAEEFLLHALAIAEALVGPHHWRITNCLNNLAAVYTAQARYAEATVLFQRSLCGLAELALAQGQHAEAEPLFRRALAIREEQLGVDHPAVAVLLEKYAALLRATARAAEAVEVEARAQIIRARQLQITPRGGGEHE